MELFLKNADTGEQRRLPGAMFQVGRGTQCEVHLPDARVALVHARISLGAQGAVMEAVEQHFVHNDREVSGAQLGVGDYIEVGPFLLHVEEPPPGVPLCLSLRRSKRVAPKSGSGVLRVLTLAPRLSKRRLSYAAFFGTLLLALVAPIAADLWGDREMPLPEPTRTQALETVKALTVGFSPAWNPGELARGHQNFEQDCRACHQEPFVHVQDKACLACHGKLRQHVAAAKLSGPMAHSLQETRCAECHRDHKGRAMAPRSQQLCASCHADVRHAGVAVASHNVSDFGTNHPHFRLSLVDAARPKEIRRVRQREGRIEERSGLKFNHVLHIDPAGVRHPDAEKRKALDCASCHGPDAEGIGFRPIVMEKHCSACHTLAFEPQVTSRQAPHAPIDEVERTLREFYARLVLGDVPAGVTPPRDLQRLRPGAAPTPEQRRQAMRIADEKARRALRELVQTRKVCSTCHYVNEVNEKFEISPVALTQRWMPSARFRHDRHATQACTSCHDVRGSRKAEDVAMPDITRCRDCHGGAKATPPRVASDCATCHVFHGGSALWR